MRSRAGMGLLLVVVVCILVVLALLAITRQLMSLGGQTRTALQAAEAKVRADQYVESALDETLRHALVADLNNPRGNDGLFWKLRRFTWPDRMRDFNQQAATLLTPGASEVDASGCALAPPPELIPLFSRACHEPVVSQRLFAADGHQVAGPVFYGIAERHGIEWVPADHNEHAGLLVLLAQARLAGVERVVEVLRGYKAVVMGAPWPYTPFTFYNRGDWLTDVDFRRNPASSPPPGFSRYETYLAEHRKLKASLAAPHVMPEYPLTFVDPERGELLYAHPTVTTTAEVAPDAYAMPHLLAVSRTGWPADPREALEQIGADYARVAKSLRTTTVEERGGHAFLSGPDSTNTRQTWLNRATEVLDDLSSHVADGVLHLDGVYYVRRAFTLDHAFTGQGIVIYGGDDDGELRIRRLERAAPDARIVVVSLRHVDASAVPTDGTLHADLVIPYGMLRGVAGRNVTVEGSLFVNRLENAGGDEACAGPRVRRVPGRGYRPWKTGERDYPLEAASQLRVFLEPGVVRRRSWTRWSP